MSSSARAAHEDRGRKIAYSPAGYEVHKAWIRARSWAQRELAKEHPERFAELLHEGARQFGALAP